MSELKSILMEEADRLAPLYETKQAMLLPILRRAQEEHGYITPEIEQLASEILSVPIVKVREVTSFYTLFYKKPVGKYRIGFCRTTSCWLRGGEEIASYIQQKLGVEDGETTPDGTFTYETVECLCACEIAPMMSVNDRYYGPLTKEKVDQILSEVKKND